jgi:hypothetical protein
MAEYDHFDTYSSAADPLQRAPAERLILASLPVRSFSSDSTPDAHIPPAAL